MSIIYAIVLCLSGNIYLDFFEQGNTAYVENRLDDAILAYEQLIASGVGNAPIHYNLASAYHHAGNSGQAVLNYERALAADPNFEAAVRGLEAVASATSRDFGLPAGFRSDYGEYPSWIRALLWGMLLTFWWLFWGILLAAQWEKTRYTRPLLSISVAGILLCGGLTWAYTHGPRPGVILSDDSLLRYGPDPRDDTRASLGAGERVLVEHVVGTWARVQTDGGLRGWIACEHVSAVIPPP